MRGCEARKRETGDQQKMAAEEKPLKKEPMTSSTAPRFQCILTNDPEKQSNEDESLYFEQEEGKKSSFLLKLNDDANVIAKPAHMLLQGSHQDAFLFGGLEMVSNARNVEIYLTGEDGKETYVTTSRGLLAAGEEEDPHRFKVVVLCPGGPRPVMRVHLKLLSLKPASCASAFLYLMKLKGRLPPPKAHEDSAAGTNHDSAKTSPAQTNNAPAAAAITQADIGQAMVGISLLVRSVETSLLQSFQASLDRLEKKLDARCDRIEQFMVMQQQQSLVQQQQQQERLVEMKNQMMEQMKEQQSEMVALMGSLHAQLSLPTKQCKTNGFDLDMRFQSTVEPAIVCDETRGLETFEEGRDELSDNELNEGEWTTRTSTEHVVEDGTSGDEATEEVAAMTSGSDHEDMENISEERDNKSISNDTEGDDSLEEEPQDAVSSDASLTESAETIKVVEEGKSATAEFEAVTDDSVKNEEGDETKVHAANQSQDETGTTPVNRNSSDHVDDETEKEQSAQSDGSKSACILDEGSDSEYAAPVMRPVMEKRDDAIEIPDLLSDLPVSEALADNPTQLKLVEGDVFQKN